MEEIPLPIKNLFQELLQHGPLRGTELITELVSAVRERANLREYCTSDLVAILDQMVKEKEIVEVDYVLPILSYKTKALYFPKGTQVMLIIP